MSVIVLEDKCRGCSLCVKNCPFDALSMKDRLAGAKIHTDVFGSDHCPVELELK